MTKPAQAQTFSQLMSQVPTPVAVVTAGAGGMMRGMTVGSLTRVSTDPELLLISLEAGSSLRKHLIQLIEAGADIPIGISVLTEHQRAFAEHFANRLNITNVHSHFDTLLGATVLDGSMVQISARLHEQVVEIAGNLLVLVHPVSYRWGLETSAAPLVYWARTWCGIERIPQESGL